MSNTLATRCVRTETRKINTAPRGFVMSEGREVERRGRRINSSRGAEVDKASHHESV
jgi:hypothetical protein